METEENKETEMSPDAAAPLPGDSPGSGKKKEGRRGSLRLQIGLLYTFLALCNILFFSVMIFENQTELLNSNFNFRYKEFIRNLREELKDTIISRKKDRNIERLRQILQKSGITEFVIFDNTGEIWHGSYQGRNKGKVGAGALREAMVLSLETRVFRTPYKMIPDPGDFAIDLYLPLKSAGESRIVLKTKLLIDQIKTRLNYLYIQILIAVIVGIIFHVIFGIFVFRVIFRRVDRLTRASNKMESGDLSARVDWKFKRKDELDELGEAFNGMAGKIEDTVETITRLNTEIQNELEIGKDVQELFLPSKSVLEEFKPAVMYRPLREVSGDIYNFFNIKDRFKALFFADATGHGVSAALVTAIILMILDNVLKKTVHPGQVIEFLNKGLSERLMSSFFATGVFFVFDEDNTCYFTNAGHNPPIFIRPSEGTAELLSKSGPPLGMFDEAEFKASRLEVKPGDKLIIYSDALVETKNAAGEMFNLERVMNLLEGNYHNSGEDILKLLESSLDSFAHEYTDDFSIIVLEIPPVSTAKSSRGVSALEKAL